MLSYFVFFIDTGHIATVYPNGKKHIKDNVTYPEVIQAGAETGIFSVFTPWSKFDTDTSIKCYIYLGYLKDSL
jgi:hypothetical protein